MSQSKEASQSPESTNPEKTRWALIQAALPLFARKGFDGTTVRDVADAAGVNVSLVSYHFNGKEGLYRTCIEEFGKLRQNKTQEILQPAQTLEEFKFRFRFLVEDMLMFMISNPYVCQIVLREVDDGLPIAKDIFEKTLMQTYLGLVEFIQDAKNKGFTRESVDPLIVAMLTQASVFHLMRTDKVRKAYFNDSIMDEEFKKKTVETLLDMFFFGFLNTVGKPGEERESKR
ncbi:MAG: TetR/AcrR family transcriptional regulator [Bdellovibrionales bacterium]